MSPESILDISNDKFFNSFALISVSFFSLDAKINIERTSPHEPFAI